MDYSEHIKNLGINNKRSISRLISLVESNNSKSVEILNEIYGRTGKALRLGITGPPGAGKSTITNQLTKQFRIRNSSVAIIAVDPTSPFTGGALLGDRVRMSDIGTDEKVFIRSMATRGNVGGLSKKAIDVADVLDAAGYDVIIFETVGVGQSELDIAQAADTTVVVLVPESGDSIQAMKAGLMEIADFFVVNKSDRPGADNALTSLKSILQLKSRLEDEWEPPILRTVASENQGIEELLTEIDKHWNFLNSSNRLKEKRTEKTKRRIKEIISAELNKSVWNESRISELDNKVNAIMEGSSSPYKLADEILTKFF